MPCENVIGKFRTAVSLNQSIDTFVRTVGPKRRARTKQKCVPQVLRFQDPKYPSN